MKPAARNLGAIVSINLDMLMTCLCSIGAWALWPTRAEWWGLGFVSITLGLVAFSTLARALRTMIQLYRRDKAVAEMLAQGGTPKSARIASDDDLKRAEMMQ